MTQLRHEKPEPRPLRFLKWLNEWKFMISFIFNILMLIMFVLGNVGMIAFILEETIQKQDFGHIIPMMNKQCTLLQLLHSIRAVYLGK